ncbi:transposase [Hyphomicrobium sp. DMF-1]|uniref:transposase n=1 Tax=Hyphomicrobium sp. DMF-1 TaxID=3019544 RepID=UPI003FA5770A
MKDDRMQKVELMTGLERRRVWTQEQKDEIMAEAFAPGANLTAVARRHDVTRAVIYRWRIERSRPPKGLAPLVVTAPATGTQGPERFIEIVIGEESHIRIPLDAPPDLVATLIKAVAR